MELDYAETSTILLACFPVHQSQLMCVPVVAVSLDLNQPLKSMASYHFFCWNFRAQTSEKMLNVTSHLGNANQNHNEIAHHSSQMTIVEKRKDAVFISFSITGTKYLTPATWGELYFWLTVSMGSVYNHLDPRQKWHSRRAWWRKAGQPVATRN